MTIRTAPIGQFAALFAAALLAIASPATRADDDSPYSGVKLIRGTVYSVGRADPRGQAGQQDLISGVFVDANYSSVFVNGGIGAKDFDGHNVINAYAGLGFGREHLDVATLSFHRAGDSARQPAASERSDYGIDIR